MSRNEEKAASMLNRWMAFQRSESNWGIRRTPGVAGFEALEQRKAQARRQEYLSTAGRMHTTTTTTTTSTSQSSASGHVPRFDRRRIGRRPFETAEVTDFRVAEKWRMQVCREAGAAIVDIQDESLPEEALRELNTRINRLMKEQERWEKRIAELGGRDHRRATQAARESASDSVSVKINRYSNSSEENSHSFAGADFVNAPLADGGSFKYFGAARNLPEVRAVFERQKAEKRQKRLGGGAAGKDALTQDATAAIAAERQRRGMMAPQTVTGGEFTAEELRAAQAAAREPLDAAYFGMGSDSRAVRETEAEVGAEVLRRLLAGDRAIPSDEATLRSVAGRTLAELVRGPGVPVPSLEEIEEELVEHRKQALLARFGGVRPAENRAASEAATALALDKKRKR